MRTRNRNDQTVRRGKRGWPNRDGFGFCFDWLGKWREFSEPIT